MRIDAEVGGKAVWAQKDDPRVTRVGAFIRKVRIDELPQAWSVLKGEMSFVGPRPERPQFVADLEARLPYYAERHVVKPGITGWAQINYPYGASIEDARQKLEFDLYYAKNYTPFLDILILLQTCGSFSGRKALADDKLHRALEPSARRPALRRNGRGPASPLER
jgi:lipopolysaccharide/colanic/teichoic acid biosynthesis glycosyltransferase